ncbi:hypothetical protein F4778DRAFT_7626 [Xylariomycetidae sp. FL2044]|nr:hypothetical protein F4778DRAFT_7626 [Xylariomycetidae sp. FL2044]
MASNRTVLITGFNGYLAGRTAEAALRAGYNVRGTVRNPASATQTLEALRELGYDKGIDVVQVPDITQPGAFDQAAVGCQAILHLASPLGEIWTTDPREVVRMALESTISILDSAMTAGPQLQSVVYMSSAAALFETPPESRIHSEEDWNTTSEPLIEELGSEAGGFNAYCASKTVSERAFWRFHKERKPAFGMTALQPTYFLGPPLVPWKSEEKIPYSISGIWQLVSGGDIPAPMMLYDSSVDIRDVARLLIWSAENPEAADGQRFVCSSAAGGGQAIADILNRHLPDLEAAEGNPGQGYAKDYSERPGTMGFDGSYAVKATGQDWIPYETTIIDTAKFLLRYLA